MVNDQIEIKEVVNPSMFKKFRNRLLQNEAFCLIVIPPSTRGNPLKIKSFLDSGSRPE
jgi:hypothetical protein